MWDTETGALEIHRVEFDRAKCRRKVEQAGLLDSEPLGARTANVGRDLAESAREFARRAVRKALRTIR
jgi:hypothetical protein